MDRDSLVSDGTAGHEVIFSHRESLATGFNCKPTSYAGAQWLRVGSSLGGQDILVEIDRRS